MIDAGMVDTQFNVYQNSLTPMVQYYHTHEKAPFGDEEINRLLPYAKQTEFIIKTFRDIVDDLGYDKEKFQKIIYAFDDDYDMLKSFVEHLNPHIKSHKELLDISESILDNLIQAQNDLGLIIAQHENRDV